MIISWIRHRTNASTSGPVLELQRRMGLEGIGLYWLAFEFFLLEKGRVRLTDGTASTLAFGWRVEPEPVREFLAHAEELGILERDGDHIVFLEVVEEIERSDRIAQGRKQAASTRWSNGHANARQMHSKCTATEMQIDAERIDREREREERKKEEAPSLPPLDLTQAEKKSLLQQMTPDELAYWERAVGLYRLRRPETARDNPWAAIQNWRERAISEGGTWNAEKKTYLKRGTAPPDERASERAKILELKKRYEEEEKRALKK